MLVVISPAKKLDWSEVPEICATDPAFQDDATYLAGVAAGLSKSGLRKMMGISEALAELNQARFRAFVAAPAPLLTRPAARAFAGDTYQGLDAASLSAGDLDRAQDHLRILSGLYGVLRPLDRIQPYRLEMGSRLKTREGGSLYAYWGARLAEALNVQAAATGSDVLVNCASTEYFDAVDRAALKLRIVTPVFLEERDGEARIISFYAKKARGAMARFILQRRISAVEDLKGFDLGGYRFSAARSDGDRLVFLRAQVALGREAA